MDWRGWLRFWRISTSLAWREAWRLLIPHTRAETVRDIFLLTIALFLLWLFQDWLVSHKLMSGDNVQDTLVGIIFAAGAIVAFFAILFIVEALFVCPYILWKRAETAEGVDLGGVPDVMVRNLRKAKEQIEEFKKNDLIPVADLWREAQRKGWNQAFAYMDFYEAIPDGAFNRKFEAWGRRKGREQGLVSLTNDLERMPAHLWENAVVSAIMMGIRDGNVGPLTEAAGFCDLYFPRKAALDWLDEEAFQFKGRAAKRNAKRSR